MNKSFISRSPGRGGDIAILVYHSISTYADPDFRRFAVHPDEFTAQMDYLSAVGYHVISVADFVAHRLERRPLPELSVVLTFDDAFADFYTIALPILLQRAFNATLYVPTGYVGRTARWLTDCNEGGRGILSWQALSEVSAEGVEVASHSHSHSQLDRLPTIDIQNEMRQSKCLIEDRLGKPVYGIAYPFGYWNHVARSVVATSGYTYACEVGELIATSYSGIYALPRLSVDAGIGVAGLAQLINTRSTRIDQGVTTLKKVAWRALRYAHAVGGDPRAGWTDEYESMNSEPSPHT